MPLNQDALRINGHSIEARIYAEDPLRGFAPDSGKILSLRHPPQTPDFRFETGIEEGDIVSTFYDPMVAKVVVHADNRNKAINKLQGALSNVQISGLSTNIGFVKSLLKHPKIRHGNINSNFIDNNFREFVLSEAPIESVCSLFCSYLIGLSLAKTQWSSIGGFVYSRRNITINNQKHSVSMRQQQQGLDFSIEIDDKPYRTRMVKALGNEVAIQLDDSIVRGVVIPSSANSFAIFIDDNTKYVVSVENQQRSESVPKEFIIRSNIPSRIIAVNVRPGDVVKAGHKLLTTEAMKMENTMKSSVDGVVAKVHCRVGQIVNSGQILVELKPI